MSVGKKYFGFSFARLQSKVVTKHCIKAACYAVVLMPHNNWFVEIGEMTIAGCRVLYLDKCEEVNSGNVKDWTSEGQQEGIKEYDRPSAIYITT